MHRFGPNERELVFYDPDAERFEYVHYEELGTVHKEDLATPDEWGDIIEVETETFEHRILESYPSPV